MKRDGYWSSPKPATANKGDAWWYANKGSIEVIVQGVNVRIKRSALVEYLKRSAK